MVVTEAMIQTDDKKSEFSQADKEKLEQVAKLETWILKLKQDLLAEAFLNTENLVRKK